jgi:xanthine dehydrogenase accessory factor
MIQRVFQRAFELLRDNHKFALLHLVKVKGSSPGKHGFKMIVTPQGERVGIIGGGDAERKMIEQALEALKEGRSRSVAYELSRKPGNLVRSLCGGQNEVFIEVFMPKPCLLLLGAGHVSRAVAALCESLEYPYVIVDDRPEFASREYFPKALDVAVMRPAQYLTRQDMPAFSHVLGLGYNAEFDLEGILPALTQLPTQVRYGTIGSKAKYVQLTQIAKERGTAEEQWRRVKCPVGLDIGAQTPAELAVAIMAEVIASIEGRESKGWS